MTFVLFFASLCLLAVMPQEGAFAATTTKLTFKKVTAKEPNADVLVSGNGYEWDGSTLLLYGVDIDTDTCITVPDGSSIELVGYNRLNATVACISCEGNLTVGGSGYLVCSGEGTGISVAQDLTVASGCLSLQSKKGIACDTLTVTGGKVSIASTERCIVFETSMTQSGGSVVCANTSVSYPAVAGSDFELSAGYLKITSVSSAISATYVRNKGGVLQAENNSNFPTVIGSFTVTAGVTELQNKTASTAMNAVAVAESVVTSSYTAVKPESDAKHIIYAKSFQTITDSDAALTDVTALDNAYVYVTKDCDAVTGKDATTLSLTGGNLLVTTTNNTALSAYDIGGTGTLVVLGTTEKALVSLSKDSVSSADKHLVFLNGKTDDGSALTLTTGSFSVPSGELITDGGVTCTELSVSGGKVAVDSKYGNAFAGEANVSSGSLTAVFQADTAINGDITVTGGSVSACAIASGNASSGDVSVNNGSATAGKLGVYATAKALTKKAADTYSYTRAASTLGGAYTAIGESDGNYICIYFGPRPVVQFNDNLPSVEVLTATTATSYVKNDTFEYNVTAPVVADAYKTKYYLAGWNTKANGTGTTYKADTFTLTGFTGNVPLYAVWAKVLLTGTAKAYSTLSEMVEYLKDEGKTGSTVKVQLLGESLTENMTVSLKKADDFFLLYPFNSNCGLKIQNGESISVNKDDITVVRTRSSEGEIPVEYTDIDDDWYTDSYLVEEGNTLTLTLSLPSKATVPTVSYAVKTGATSWDKYIVGKIVDDVDATKTDYYFADCSTTALADATIAYILEQRNYNYAKSSFTVVGSVNTSDYLPVTGVKKKDGTYYTTFYNFVNAQGVSTPAGLCKHQSGTDNTQSQTVNTAHTEHTAYVNQLISVQNGAVCLKSSCVSIKNVTVSALVDKKMTETQVTLSAYDVEFQAGDLEEDDVLDDWFIGLPSGMTASFVSLSKSEIKVEISGTPSVRCYALLSVKVPKAYLKDFSVDLTSVENPSALYESLGELEIDETQQTTTYNAAAQQFELEYLQSYSDAFGTKPDDSLVSVTYKLGSTVVLSPTVAGSYDVVISVQKDTKALFAAFSTTITNGFVIEKKAVSSADYTYTEPSALVYDGSKKDASVVKKDNSMGDFEIGYYVGTEKVEKAVNVGTYTVKAVAIQAGANFQESEDIELGSFTITKATLTPSAGLIASTSYTYDGDTHTIDINKTKITAVNGQTVTFTYSEEETTGYTETMPSYSDHGEYTVYCKISAPNHDDYFCSATVTVNVKAYNTTDFDSTAISDLPYTGDEQEPIPEIVYNQMTLSETTDMTLSYTDNKLVGLATVSVTFIGNYSGSTSVTFNIIRATLIPSVQSVSDKTYDGTMTSSGSLTFTGAVKSDLPTATATFTWTSSAAETATVNVTDIVLDLAFTDRYVLSTTSLSDVTVKNPIAKATITVTALEQSGTLTYNGTAQKPSLTKTISSVNAQTLTVKYSLQVSGTYSEDVPTVTDAGSVTYYYIVTAPNHADKKGSFEVTVAKSSSIAASMFDFSVPNDLVYEKTGKKATVTVKSGYSGVGTVTVEYDFGGTWKTDIPKDIGTYAVRIQVAEGKNYLEKEDVTDAAWSFTIVVCEVDEPTITKEYVYNTKKQTAELNGFDEESMTITSGNTGTDVGDYTVEITLDGNHTWKTGSDGKVSWNISKFLCEEPSVKGTYTYNEDIQTVSLEGFDGKIMKIEKGNTGTNVQEYEVVISLLDDKNYGWKEGSDGKVTWAIGALDIKDAVITLGMALTYNGAEQTQSVVAVTVGEIGVVGYTVSNATETDAGSYTLSVTAGGNFKGKATKEFVIAALDITDADVTLGDALTYNGTEQTQTVSKVLLNSLEVTFSLTNNVQTNAGDYTLSINGTGNFSGSITEDYTIERLSVETAVITLGDVLYYTAESQKQSLASVKVGDLTLTEDDYSVTDDENVVVGEYVLTISGVGNYCGTAQKAYVIEHCAVEEPKVKGVYYYTGFNVSMEFEKLPSYMTIESGKTAKVVGEYTVELSLNENYTWKEGNDGKVSWSILKAANTITKLRINDWAYGEKANKPITEATFGTVTVTYSASKNGQFTDTVPTDCGTYYIKGEVEGTENYFGATHGAVAFTIKHTYTAWMEIDLPTCTETGLVAHKDCICCARHFNDTNEILDDIVIPANGHTYLWKEKEQSIVQYCGVCQVEFESCAIENDQNTIMLEPSTRLEEKEDVILRQGDKILNNSGSAFRICVGKKGLFSAMEGEETDDALLEDSAYIEKGGVYELEVAAYTRYKIVGTVEKDGVICYIIEKDETLNLFEITGIVAGSIIAVAGILYVVGIFLYRKRLLSSKFMDSLFSWVKRIPVEEVLEIEEL